MKLYARIWLAIVATVAALTLLLGLVWQNHMNQVREQMRDQVREQTREPARDVPRELDVRDLEGQVVGRAKPPPRRTEAELDALLSGEAPQRKRSFEITLNNGQQLEFTLPNRPARMMRPNPPWYFSPWGFAVLLAVIALAVALGAYPIVRRLTKRLETLQVGVERWGSGNLSERVTVEGHDEVAFLATKFNHAAAQVETLVTAHKTLLANASHELRSPLARIRMGLEVMDSVEIKRNIAELDALIEEILLASRLDSPNVDMGVPEALDVMGLAAEECARTGAELIVEPSKRQPADVPGAFELVGYPRLMRRLIRNLLENAAKYNDAAQGVVTLSLAVDPSGAIIITVRDHGIGVASNEVERIFEPFYRAKNASERDGGVGLGLALVKTIAQKHGGSVRCISQTGMGQTSLGQKQTGGCFEVQLPSHTL